MKVCFQYGKNKAGKWVSVIEDVHGNQIVDMEFDMYCDERNGIFYLKRTEKIITLIKKEYVGVQNNRRKQLQ